MSVDDRQGLPWTELIRPWPSLPSVPIVAQNGDSITGMNGLLQSRPNPGWCPKNGTVEHTELHWMEKVGHRGITYNTGNISHLHWNLGEHSATRVWHRLPWCRHLWVFDTDCDSAGGVACHERHILQVRSLDNHNKNRQLRVGFLSCEFPFQ